jgi:hypothetical protein
MQAWRVASWINLVLRVYVLDLNTDRYPLPWSSSSVVSSCPLDSCRNECTHFDVTVRLGLHVLLHLCSNLTTPSRGPNKMRVEWWTGNYLLILLYETWFTRLYPPEQVGWYKIRMTLKQGMACRRVFCYVITIITAYFRSSKILRTNCHFTVHFGHNSR